ncbi:MAG: threonine/serine exporter family protein [Peptoniphilaceae bacterium]|nr:threonine/serine exporter family protein [Peptoniphilaceae bacterium]MDY6019266.1 threonine/serine exporter family protein [Anaerococcus sp.]
MDLFLEFITSLIAVMGFAYSFSAPKVAVVFSGISGAIGWVIYYILINKTGNLYICNTIAAFIIGILGEIFARKFRMPSSCFTIPSILALAPGTSIFYMITYLISNHRSLAIEKMLDAIVISGSISFGILLASVWSRSLKRFKKSKPYRTKDKLIS